MPNRSVDDARLFILDKLYGHLEKKKTGSHAKILFADFSSCFNTLQPLILVHKLIENFSLDPQLVLWISDFLTNQGQHVVVNQIRSDMLNTNVGSPQGCVLSPLLFILYTNDLRSNHDNRFIVKFADDSAILSYL